MGSVLDSKPGSILISAEGKDRGCFQAAQFAAEGTVVAQNLENIQGFTADNRVDAFPCDVCVGINQLVKLARERVTRGLLPAERTQYLH